MLFNRYSGIQSQTKYNFCAGFNIKKRSLNQKISNNTERIVPATRPATAKRLSAQPQVIQNGIYFGLLAQAIAPSDLDLMKVERRKPILSNRPQTAMSKIKNFSITQQINLVAKSIYPDSKSINTIQHLMMPLKYQRKKNSQPTIPINTEHYFREISPKTNKNLESKNISIQTKLIPNCSDKLITQFFQRGIKTKNKQSIPYITQQIIGQNVVINDDTLSMKQQQIRPVMKFTENKSKKINLKSYEYIMTDDDINPSFEELECVASGLLSKALDQSKATQMNKHPKGSQQDQKHFPTDSIKIIKRPQTSNVSRVQSPFLNSQQFLSEYDNSLERFAIGEIIGSGSYAIVRLARDKISTKQVAIKSYEKSNLTDLQKRNNVKREIQILSKISHPNIIKLFMKINTPTSINLVMEYPGSLSMRNYLKQFENKQLKEDDARQKFKQIVQAINYCHTQNVIHRDIKLENILIDSHQNIKVIDFGFAVQIHEGSKLNIFCGTPSYMAPELLNKQAYMGKPVDVWSLGVLLYVILNGQFPFRGKENNELFQAIQSGSFRMKVDMSLTASRLIHNMLRVKQTDRITTEDILRDAWFH